MAVILAIDEDVVLTMSLDLQLGHVGHTVRRANTVIAATTHYNEEPPSVVVIDPSLDDQNGWQLVTQWATLVPVIVISHDPTDATNTRAQALGCAAVLAKPFLMRDLVNLVTPYLETPAPPKTTNKKRSTTQNSADGAAKPARTPRKRVAEPSEATSPPPAHVDTLGISMSDVDEQLLAGLPTTAPVPPVVTQSRETLGMRLRTARLKRNIPLSQIDLIIGVRMTHVQAMEADRFSHLPRGRMAEEIITKYVRYLGMDVNEALEHYRGFQYAEHVEPLMEFGADKLQYRSYGWIIRVVLALLVLAAIGWGIYTVDRDRVMQRAGGIIEVVFPPSLTPTLTITASVTLTPSPTTTPSLTATATPSATATVTLTASHTASATITPSKTAKPTFTDTPSRTARPSRTPRPSKTAVPSRTPRPSKTAVPSDTAVPSKTALSTMTVTPSTTPPTMSRSATPPARTTTRTP